MKYLCIIIYILIGLVIYFGLTDKEDKEVDESRNVVYQAEYGR